MLAVAILGTAGEEDRKTVFKIVDKMLTTKKFNTFFQENLQK